MYPKSPAMTRLPPPLISLKSATFHRTPNSSRALFPNTTFTLHAPPTSSAEKWTVLGPSKSAFLSILRGGFLASPPNSRLYPALAWPASAIQTVSFGGGSSQGMLCRATGGDNYVSARYETLREVFDVTLREWLGADHTDAEKAAVADRLGLGEMLDQDVMTLSNGQSRRARLAQALLRKPKVLLVDEPFMGLDPPGKGVLEKLLGKMSDERMAIVLGLRQQDSVPEWSTHMAYTDADKLVAAGPKADVVKKVHEMFGHGIHLAGSLGAMPAPIGIVEKAWTADKSKTSSKLESSSTPTPALGESLIEMSNVRIAYYSNVILSDFNWTIRRGEKWGLFGPNGSGKTTLTSLLTSDHPLTYSLPIKHFGKTREPGVSVWDIQARIGIASPEIHSFFPRHLTLRRCVLSGFAETFLSPPKVTSAETDRIDFILSEFSDLLPGGVNWDTEFGDADMSSQRLALFLRATVPKRDLVVFDETFSGMREQVRERCFAFLETEKGWDEDRQAMVVISHVSEEVPKGVRKWVRLAEKGGGERAVIGEIEA